MKIARRYPLLILFVCALLSQHQLWSQVRNSEEAAQKMGHLMYFIETYYNDSTSLDQLTDQAIKAIMQQLDPYSVYVPTDELAAMNEPLDGEFEGIGIEFAIVSDTLVVQAVVAGGPSERVGLLPGDRIVGVDGACISSDSLTIDRVRQLLRGPSGSKVQLQVLRKRSASELVFTVTRDKIPLHSLDAAYLTDEGFLYLRLSRFAHKTGEELHQALDRFASAKGIILDLRGNTGGFLHAALEVANEFLERGQLIVYTQGRSVKPIREYADGSGLYQEGPLVVLVDEYSASASEIVAGAIQDWGRGAVIGRTTFGKGLVQQPFPLPDGSQVRLTVAGYHTPSGRKLERDNGIQPDIAVPADTLSHSDAYVELISSGALLEFVNQKALEVRETLLACYPSSREYVRRFEVDKAWLTELTASEQARGEVKLLVKAILGRILYEQATYYQVLQQEGDPEFDAAVAYLLD